MSKPLNDAAARIGTAIREARLDKGYASRSSLVDVASLRGKLSPEGLRKIEAGERVPRLENIRHLGEALGLPSKKIKSLEQLALTVNVERVTRRAGNVAATIHIDGKPVRVEALPPKRKSEEFARKTTKDVMELAERLGWFKIPQDREWFRRHTRQVILKNLNPDHEES